MPNSYSYHGGGCCGMSHVIGMRRNSLDRVDMAMQELPRHHCIEVVMTDQQIQNSPDIARGLKQRGFKLVSRFLNDNSGNYCNVLHHYRLSGKDSGKKNSPFNKV